jgi:cyanophycinase-like exopeptidase
VAARLVAILGSGETAPTMVKVHRDLLDRAGGPAAVLDTPYGFQENADDVTARAVDYFRRSVGREVGVASLRSAGGDPVREEAALARLRAAALVFAGPGSPTYALRQWRATPVPALLAAKLAAGGCVTFASAAALTLGIATVPVYEIYKAGEPPRWEEGLDLLSAAGLRVAVIPHYDNAEGGTHDTRYCYLGERRLAALERVLPDGAFVLGVDEHTGLVLDLGAGTGSVVGLGGVTVRSAGRSVRFPAGTTVAVADLVAAAEAGPAGGAASPVAPGTAGPAAPVAAPPAVGPAAEAERQQAAFDAAVAAGDVTGAVGAVLALEEALVAWSGDTYQSDEPDRARSVLRGMVVALGDLAERGARTVDAVLDARRRAREAGDYPTADALRDAVTAAGIEVRDTPTGTEWQVTGGAS